MTAINLRALAKDYANGLIDRENYRQTRADLIASIVAGETSVEPREFIAPVEAKEGENPQNKTTLNNEAETFEAGYSTPLSTHSESDKLTQRWIIGSAIAVIIICCIVIISLLL